MDEFTLNWLGENSQAELFCKVRVARNSHSSRHQWFKCLTPRETRTWRSPQSGVTNQSNLTPQALFALESLIASHFRA